MICNPRALLSAMLACSMLACSTVATTYTPRTVPRDELWFRYQSGVEVWQGPRKLCVPPDYAGLSQAVACVPEARRHADKAASAGRAAIALSWVAAGLAVVGLGGLSGFAVDDRGTRIALLSTGVGFELIGLLASGLAYGRKAQAHGHAMDAVNFYNDRGVDSDGGCASAGH